MRNPDTGQEVVCYSGWYSFEEGGPEVRIAEQCIDACNRYGFLLFTGNRYADHPHPHDPDEDVKPFIPAPCLP